MKTGFCPHCTGEVEFPDNTIGLESSCPYCDEEFILMEAGGGSVLSKPAVLYSLITVFTAGAVAGGVFYFKGGDKEADAGEESPDQLAQLAEGLAPQPSENPFSGSSAPPPPPPGGNGMSMGMDNGMDNGMMNNGMMDNGLMAMAGGAGGVTFDKDIKPIFERACTRCHGPDRQRGDLRIDSLAEIRRSQVATAGQSSRSALYTRVSLPAGDDDIMPPKDGPLPAAEINLIKQWIDGGMR